MSYPTKPLAEATAEEVRAFAEIAHGLEVPAKCNKDTIVNKLRAVGWQGETIRLFSAPTAGPLPARGPGDVPADAIFVRNTSAGPRTYICVYIPSTEGKSGQLPVPVGVNGNHMLVPRNKPALISEEFHEALLNAQIQLYTGRDESGDMRGLESHPSEVASYPFTYRSAASAVNYRELAGEVAA